LGFFISGAAYLCGLARNPTDFSERPPGLPRAGIRSLRPDILWHSLLPKGAKSVTGECHTLYNQALINGLSDRFDWETG